MGETDELGFNIVEGKSHVHDIQATILRCLGVDHEKLSVNVNGLDVRLTGVEKHRAITELIA